METETILLIIIGIQGVALGFVSLALFNLYYKHKQLKEKYRATNHRYEQCYKKLLRERQEYWEITQNKEYLELKKGANNGN